MVWQHELGPQVDQLVDLDVEPHIVLCAIGEDLLVDARTIARVREVVESRRSAPADPHRELDEAARLGDTGRVNVVRDRYRARLRTK